MYFARRLIIARGVGINRPRATCAVRAKAAPSEDVAETAESNADTIGIVGGIVLAVILLVAHSSPRIPLNEGAVTAGSIITVVAALVASLVGAILGGLAGMLYHRRVDKAGLGR